MSKERPVKQTLIIRKDLKMRRGKEIAQAAHASISFMTRALEPGKKAGTYTLTLSAAAQQWVEGNFAKITLQVDSEEALLEVYQAACDAGVEAHLITDAGLTEFGGVPTRTALALGPDYCDRIDALTCKLQLY